MVFTDNLLCNMHDKICCFYDCFSSLLFFLHFLWLIRCEQFHIIFKHMQYQMSISQRKFSNSSSSNPSKNSAKLSRCTSWSSLLSSVSLAQIYLWNHSNRPHLVCDFQYVDCQFQTERHSSNTEGLFWSSSSSCCFSSSSSCAATIGGFTFLRLDFSREGSLCGVLVQEHAWENKKQNNPQEVEEL